MLIFHEALEVTIAFSLAYILYPNPTSGLYYSPLLGTGAQAGEEQDIAPFYEAVLRFPENTEDAGKGRKTTDGAGGHQSLLQSEVKHQRSSTLSLLSSVSITSMTRRRSSVTAEFEGAGESKATLPPSESIESATDSMNNEGEPTYDYNVKRPWWLMASRNLPSSSRAAGGVRRQQGIIVVIQNPTRSTTAMAARCRGSRASIMVGRRPPPGPPPRRISSRDIIGPSQTAPTPPDEDEWSSGSSEDVVADREDIVRRRLSTGSNNSSSLEEVGMVGMGPQRNWRRNVGYVEMEMTELGPTARRSSASGSGLPEGPSDRYGRQVGNRRSRRRASAPPPPPPTHPPPPPGNPPRVSPGHPALHSAGRPRGQAQRTRLIRSRTGSLGRRRRSLSGQRRNQANSSLNEPLNAEQRSHE